MSIFKNALDKSQKSAEEYLSNLQKISSEEPTWTKPQPINTRIEGTGCNGVYKIYHRDDLEKPKAIGQGNIGGRKSRYMQVLNNRGIAKDHAGGSSSSCVVATKMYKKDSNTDHWFFSFCEIENKLLREQYETDLIEDENPDFNAKHMAGK